MTSRELLLEAVRRGYRVDQHGNAYSSRGLLAKRVGGDNYYAIAFKVDGKVKSVAVHRIAAYQLFGDRLFDAGIQVRHLDNNHQNNAAENLTLGSPGQNSLDRPAAKRHAMAVHASNVLRRLSEEDVRALCADRAAGMEYRDLAVKYKVALGTAHYAVKKNLLGRESVGLVDKNA